MKRKSNTNESDVIGLKKKNEWDYFKSNLPLTLLALPTIIYIFIFSYIPLYGIVLPFKDYRPSLGFFRSPWIGLKNFKFLLHNRQLVIAVRNTLLYNAAFIILGTAFTVMVALLLYEMSARSVKLYQTAIYLPYYISWVIAAYAFSVFLDMDYGILNKILGFFGHEPVLWYNSPKYWPPILIIAELWKGFGSSAVIYYAALMGLDKSLFEAAEIDGAGKLKQMFYISIPGIKPMIIMLTILKIGSVFYGDFGLFYNFTMNSALLYETTDIIDTYVYRTLINLGDVGISSAVNIMQAILGFILVLTTNSIVKKLNSDSSLF